MSIEKIIGKYKMPKQTVNKGENRIKGKINGKFSIDNLPFV